MDDDDDDDGNLQGNDEGLLKLLEAGGDCPGPVLLVKNVHLPGVHMLYMWATCYL